MLIRLLQKFSSIELCPEAEPRMIAPPSFTDSPGSNGSDKIHMRSHITLYATVSSVTLSDVCGSTC